MTDSTYFYQTVGFYFLVRFENLPNQTSADVRFQSVTGLDVDMETETVKEGGQNHFEHVVPVRSKFASVLTLKRGLLLPGSSGLTQWCIDTFIHLKVKPLPMVTVELLNENGNAMVKWDLEHVWPKSWKVAEFNAERSEVLIETLELHYNRFTVKKV